MVTKKQTPGKIKELTFDEAYSFVSKIPNLKIRRDSNSEEGSCSRLVYDGIYEDSDWSRSNSWKEVYGQIDKIYARAGINAYTYRNSDNCVNKKLTYYLKIGGEAILKPILTRGEFEKVNNQIYEILFDESYGAHSTQGEKIRGLIKKLTDAEEEDVILAKKRELEVSFLIRKEAISKVRELNRREK